MNNRKTLYWTIGVIVALLLIFLVWGMNNNKSGDQQNTMPEASSASQAENGVNSDEHAGMNHGTTQESISAGTSSGDAEYNKYMEEQTEIMDRMMREMALADDGSNATLDFLDGMIPHHQAAVSMAESYLNNGGSHEQLKPLAEDIITAQKEEITQMRNMKKAISDADKKDKEKAAAYREEYQKMMEGHHNSHGSSNTSGSIDAAFAEGMIMHHQMAVDMAKAILDNTDEEDVLKLSRQIIDAQEEEITLMQKVLQE